MAPSKSSLHITSRGFATRDYAVAKRVVAALRDRGYAPTLENADGWHYIRVSLLPYERLSVGKDLAKELGLELWLYTSKVEV